ncbi:MAG: M15 family metallopeptidase [Cyanobacteria bacterium P01_A01_bin.135]
MSPHPYAERGAPYGTRSPYYLREGVVERLLQAQVALQQEQSDWQLCLFDAYRPVAVQQFMVDATFAEQLSAQGLERDALTPQQTQQVWQQVYQFWAPPSKKASMPPPHSTGAAVDLTLADETGQPVDMGSPIDEISPRSFPKHFAAGRTPEEQAFHYRRQLLNAAMADAGFRRHQQEWWHFSYGDQMWAWLMNQEQPAIEATACYGGV